MIKWHWHLWTDLIESICASGLQRAITPNIGWSVGPIRCQIEAGSELYNGCNTLRLLQSYFFLSVICSIIRSNLSSILWSSRRCSASRSYTSSSRCCLLLAIFFFLNNTTPRTKWGSDTTWRSRNPQESLLNHKALSRARLPPSNLLKPIELRTTTRN